MGDKKGKIDKDRNYTENRIEKDRGEKEEAQAIPDDIEQQRIERLRVRMARAVDGQMRITIETLALPVEMTKQLPEAAEKSTSQLMSTTQKTIQALRWDLPASIDAFLKGNIPEVLSARAEELTRVLWQGVQTQYTTFWEYWLPAQQHMINMTKTGIEAATSAQEAISIIIEAGKEFDPMAYRDRIRDLADYMWRQHGSPIFMNPLSYWVSAEKHILAVASRAIRAATSPSDVGHVLAAAIETFDPGKYFESIRREAYFIWGATVTHGHDIDDWLKAENAVRDRE
jgi:hypothetical protein